MSKYRSPDLTRQFCCKGGSSCGFAYKHFICWATVFNYNCEGFHVSHVSSMNIQNWIMSFPCISSLNSLHSKAEEKGMWLKIAFFSWSKCKAYKIQLASYTRSFSNYPGIIQNSGIKPGNWWHWVLQNWPVLLAVTDMGKVLHHVPGAVFLSLTLELFPYKVVPALLNVLLKEPTNCRSKRTHTCVTQRVPTSSEWILQLCQRCFHLRVSRRTGGNAANTFTHHSSWRMMLHPMLVQANTS